MIVSNTQGYSIRLIYLTCLQVKPQAPPSTYRRLPGMAVNSQVEHLSARSQTCHGFRHRQPASALALLWLSNQPSGCVGEFG